MIDLERLADALRGHAAIRTWRFDVVDRRSASWTAVNRAIGTPHAPSMMNERTIGTIEIGWGDQTVTRGRVGHADLSVPAEAIEAWRSTRLPARGGTVPLLPSTIPSVATSDPTIGELVDEPTEQMGRLVERLGKRLARGARGTPTVYLAMVDGVRTIGNSAGLWHAWRETSVSLEAGVEGFVSDQMASRRWEGELAAERLVERVRASSQELADESEPPQGECWVLLGPGVVAELVERFLVRNLSGVAILAGRSALSLTDVRESRVIADVGLSIGIDTLEPFAMSASPCSASGVAGGVVQLVESGRLRSPTVDLASVERLGLPPTPIPRGQPRLVLSSIHGRSDLASVIDDGAVDLVVGYALGAHTMDARSGRYVLTAPSAQRPRGGRAACVIEGNFLEQLRDPRVRLVQYPDQRVPGLLVAARVGRMPSKSATWTSGTIEQFEE
jgi:hypothetical protein